VCVCVCASERVCLHICESPMLLNYPHDTGNWMSEQDKSSDRRGHSIIKLMTGCFAKSGKQPVSLPLCQPAPLISSTPPFRKLKLLQGPFHSGHFCILRVLPKMRSTTFPRIADPQSLDTPIFLWLKIFGSLSAGYHNTDRMYKLEIHKIHSL